MVHKSKVKKPSSLNKKKKSNSRKRSSSPIKDTKVNEPEKKEINEESSFIALIKK